MYLSGEGIKQDNNKAFDWYKKAALQGQAEAQYNFGSMYYNGTGVKQDYATAFMWLQKAANQNVDEAQELIGYMYHNGYGVAQNDGEAEKWYAIACANEKQLGCLKMTADEID